MFQDASEEVSMFEVKVVETQSDSRSEGSSVEQLVHGTSDVQHVQQPEIQENLDHVHPSSTLVSPDHGPLCFHSGGPEGGGLSHDRTSDGIGGSINKEQVRSGEVRLAADSICGPETPPIHSGPMQGEPSIVRTRQPIRQQWSRSVAGLQGVRVTYVPTWGSKGTFRIQASDESSQVGEDQEREVESATSEWKRERKDRWRFNAQHDGIHCGKEDTQEGTCHGLRAAGDRRSGSHRREGVARGALVSHDLPKGITDDALCLHEADTSVSYMTHQIVNARAKRPHHCGSKGGA